MRVPGTARRSSQSILKEISPEYSLEGLRLKLELQHFGHLMGRVDPLEKTLKKKMKKKKERKDLDAGKDRRQEEKGKTEDEMTGWHH